MIQQSKSLRYEPSSEPLHISAKQMKLVRPGHTRLPPRQAFFFLDTLFCFLETLFRFLDLLICVMDTLICVLDTLHVFERNKNNQSTRNEIGKKMKLERPDQLSETT